MLLFVAYAFIINLIGYIIMGLDKKRARNGQWRISEKTLWLIILLGGSLGSLMGMNQFRHKTKHLSFKIGVPTVIIFQITVILLLLIKM